MPHRHLQSEAAWVRFLVPATPSRARLWVLGLILTAWVSFLLAMYFLTVALRPAHAPPTPSSPIVAKYGIPLNPFLPMLSNHSPNSCRPTCQGRMSMLPIRRRYEPRYHTCC